MPPGPPGEARRGVGRLAQITGATVLPMAIAGTEPTNARRFPPAPIRVRTGAPLHFDLDPSATRAAATLATERIWDAVTQAFEELPEAYPLPSRLPDPEPA